MVVELVKRDVTRNPVGWLVAICVACAAMTVSACAANPHSADNAISLQASLGEFHKNLKWARYDHASLMVAPSYRETFMGRYEELGEDFHIIALEVKKVELDGSRDRRTAATATVVVEQKWYREPSMTVKKERFVERWERNRAGWNLKERMKKKAWERRKKEERLKREAAEKLKEKKLAEAKAAN